MSFSNVPVGERFRFKSRVTPQAPGALSVAMRRSLEGLEMNYEGVKLVTASERPESFCCCPHCGAPMDVGVLPGASGTYVGCWSCHELFFVRHEFVEAGGGI